MGKEGAEGGTEGGTMNRREYLKMMACSALVWQVPLARAGAAKRAKLVWILLRGGMDGLHAVLPLADPDLRRHRKEMVDAVSRDALRMDRGFALHPAHFQAQDILECGLPQLDQDNGWLNRAVSAHQGEGLAIAHSMPISLRGKTLMKTWYPDRLPEADEDLYDRLAGLYEKDDLLYSRLMDGLQTREQLGEMGKQKAARRFPMLAKSCATLMNQPDGPDCAMLDMGGWDTHNNATNRLGRQIADLDQGIANLRAGLGAQWHNTVVIVASEFGRTVAMNGTRGTDHGTAGALLLAGGAGRGGQGLGDWPGLAKSEQYEGRDLRPTSDVRSWLSAVLQQHWQLSDRQLQGVFPGVTPYAGRVVV